MSVLATKKIINQTYQKWTESFSSYPATDYTLRIYFFKDSSNKFGIDGTASGTDFEFILDPNADGYKGKLHGKYNYQISAKDSDDVEYPVEDGAVTFLPNLEKDEDPRSDNQIMLEDAKAALKKLNSKEASSVNALGMEVTYEKRALLVKEIKRLETLVAREQGKRVNRNIGVKFY